MKMPMLGRSGTSAPSSIMVCWPMRGAGNGVAGARMASTDSNSRSICVAIPAAELLRLDHERPRHHRPGDEPVAHGRLEIRARVRRRSRCRARALAGRDDEGGGAGARGLRDLDLAGDAERLGDLGHRGQRLGRGAAPEIAAGDGDAQAADAGLERRQRRLGGPLGADGVLGVVALHGVVGERQVARGARQRPHMIEARHEREGAGAREPAVGRLQPEEAAERGRHADRAVGVGAERDRHQAAGHRCAGAARRAAGHMRRVVRVARGAVVHVLAGEVVGVLAHVERADEDGAGRLQPRDQRGVGGGRRAGRG